MVPVIDVSEKTIEEDIARMRGRYSRMKGRETQ
jgi:hypothetical protein